MKLYVWHDALCDYTCGVIFALANSADEARDIIRREPDWLASGAVELALKEDPTEYSEPIGFILWGGG